jgi:maltokinase
MNREELAGLLPAYLPRQRWFAGHAADGVEVVDYEVLREGWPALVWALVVVSGSHYQVVVGGRPLGEPAEFLGGHEAAVLGEADGAFWYDAVLDPVLARRILEVVTAGRETAERVRMIGVEQSNSSIVFDDRLIGKVFRRLQPGRNPDVEVTTALFAEGFPHVAEPVGWWTRDGYDLAIVQQFLHGGSEGWALALTSLRDLYASGDDPAEAGGDFAGEAERLGRMTAAMHVAMASAFGRSKGDAVAWAAAMEPAFDGLDEDEHRAGAHRLLVRLRNVLDAGAAIRVHGDYHLGQVMRIDAGWYTLDFEGEPARSLEERRSPSSPMKDVAGMLRSFDYAAQAVLHEREPREREQLIPLADAWARRNRQAFLDGYLVTDGIDALMPSDGASFAIVLSAFALDKAVYELDYELAYRPGWVEIPRAAIARLIGDPGTTGVTARDSRSR